MTAQPLAYGLYNAATGKLDSRLFQRQESAVVAAKRLTGRWRTIVAVPLFITGESADTPGVPAPDVPCPTVDMDSSLFQLDPSGEIQISSPDHAAAGRIFKWLIGHVTVKATDL